MGAWPPFCEFCGSEMFAVWGVFTCRHCGARFDDAMFVLNQPIVPTSVTKPPTAHMPREKMVEHPERTTMADVVAEIIQTMKIVNGDEDGEQEG